MVTKDEMSESERAAYYHQHKDDPEVWGEDAQDDSAAGPARTLGATITVRLAADDAALLRRAAKDLDVSYSELVRKAVESYASVCGNAPTDGSWDTRPNA